MTVHNWGGQLHTGGLGATPGLVDACPHPRKAALLFPIWESLSSHLWRGREAPAPLSRRSLTPREQCPGRNEMFASVNCYKSLKDGAFVFCEISRGTESLSLSMSLARRGKTGWFGPERMWWLGLSPGLQGKMRYVDPHPSSHMSTSQFQQVLGDTTNQEFLASGPWGVKPLG